MKNPIKSTLAAIRTQKPLILCLTNQVTMEFVANCLLAIGASPIMSASRDEFEELIALCDALYINIGTLEANFIDNTRFACSLIKNKPVVLDPVGAGATQLRTRISQEISAFSTIIRGNASEILALSNQPSQTKGVDSTDSVDSAKQTAYRLATLKKIIAISGPIDYITNGTKAIDYPFGHDLMAEVTGMGCALGAVMAAFSAVVSDPFEASCLATLYYGLCGQLSAMKHLTPGSFKTTFLDTLYQPDFDMLTTILSTKEGRLYDL